MGNLLEVSGVDARACAAQMVEGQRRINRPDQHAVDPAVRWPPLGQSVSLFVSKPEPEPASAIRFRFVAVLDPLTR